MIPTIEGDLDPQVERVERPVQDQLVDAERVAPGMPADHRRHSGRSMKCQTGLKKTNPTIIPRDEGERHLDDPVAQLPEVIHERHPALGVLLPLRAHEALADDAGTRDGTGEFRHDRCLRR